MERAHLVAEQAPRVALGPDHATVKATVTLHDHDVHRILAEVPEERRGDFALRAFKVGVLALRDTDAVAKTDLVEKEFARMRAEFDGQLKAMREEVQRVFGEDGEVDRRMEGFFGSQGRFATVLEAYLGPDGKLTRSLDDRIGEDGDFHRTLDELFGERGVLRQELDREFGAESGRVFRLLDPASERSPLGQFRKALEERLDPGREGSPLHSINRNVDQQFERLRRELNIQQAVAEERAKGHDKGFDFQDHVLDLLVASAAQGDRVEDVSKVKGPLGDVGDALVSLDPSSTAGADRRIVVEAKNRPVTLTGQRSIHKELAEALRNRDAHFAIAAVHADHAGKFAPFRYCAPDQIIVAVAEDDDGLPLRTALLVARTLVVARAAEREADLDVGAVLARLQRIGGHLEAVRAMRTGLTGAMTGIEKVAAQLDDMRNKIRDEVEALVEEVGGAKPGAAQATLGALGEATG